MDLTIFSQIWEHARSEVTENQNVWRGMTIDAFSVAVGTLVLTIVLEVCCLDTVRGVWKQPNGAELYRQGWMAGTFNLFVLGVPLYIVAGSLICVSDIAPETELVGQRFQRLTFEVVWVLSMHSLFYYYIHKAFHEVAWMYQRFHRFHHRFHSHTPPSSANAVTVGEYLLAYILPLVPIISIRPVTPTGIRIALVILSALNLLVHTPPIEAWSARWIPSFWVSTNNHLDHHRKLTSHYASPTLNIDTLVETTSSLFKKH